MRYKVGTFWNYTVPNCTAVKAASRSRCWMWEALGGGLEHGSHGASDVGPYSLVPDHRAAEVTNVG